jgi:6-pyruvoyl-tetrahydropterin synthase
MTEPGYEVGTSVRFSATHVMAGAEGPEGVLHEHEYRVDVVVGRERLDESGMVCDLDLLGGALDRLRGQVEGQDLEVIRPPHVDSVTVEVFAEWAHGFLAQLLPETGADTLTVRVWESEVAFGGYTNRLG